MLTFSFRDGNFVVERVSSVGDLDSLDGDAGCGARLRPLPIMPSDYTAVVPQVAGYVEDQLDQARATLGGVVEVRVRTLERLAR